MSKELEKREKQEVNSNVAEQMNYSGKSYSPDVDIYISETKAVFLVDIPGVKKGDVTIEVDKTNNLIIRGNNTSEEPKSESVMKQYRIGNYYRSFQISDEFDKEHITASLENGLLEISIPKREESIPKRIEIKA